MVILTHYEGQKGQKKKKKLEFWGSFNIFTTKNLQFCTTKSIIKMLFSLLLLHVHLFSFIYNDPSTVIVLSLYSTMTVMGIYENLKQKRVLQVTVNRGSRSLWQKLTGSTRPTGKTASTFMSATGSLWTAPCLTSAMKSECLTNKNVKSMSGCASK